MFQLPLAIEVYPEVILVICGDTSQLPVDSTTPTDYVHVVDWRATKPPCTFVHVAVGLSLLYPGHIPLHASMIGGIKLRHLLYSSSSNL